ncbi:MAG: DNA polymerase IV [bacterium]
MFLCADLDAFFVSVEQALDPTLIAKPVIVGGLPKERGVVASASYEARKFGIHSGMPTAHAHRLCPHAIFLKGNFEHYRWFSRKFYKILSSFSPDINMSSIDEAYVNIKGTKRLFGPQLALAKRLKSEIKTELNIPVSIGIARTKIFSKIACDRSKPDGLLVIQPDEEMEFLSPLAVSVLPGIGPKHVAILKNLNINTIAELLKTPDWALGVALGNYAKVLKFFINGGDFNSCDRIKSISRETTLTEDTLDKNLVYALFYYLTERACATLRGKKLLANLVTVKIRFSDFKTVSKRAKIPPSNAQQVIFEYGTRVLQDILQERKRVRLTGIALSKFQYDGLQPSMFEIKQRRLNQLNFALDRVRDKFGFSSLYPANTSIMHKCQDPNSPAERDPRFSYTTKNNMINRDKF